MARVSAAEFQRRFGTYSEQAQREPVTITRHGRDSLVLMSNTTYERLRALDTRKAYPAWERPDDVVEAMERDLERLEAEERSENRSDGHHAAE